MALPTLPHDHTFDPLTGEVNGPSGLIVFHYTTLIHLLAILADGYLKAKTDRQRGTGERPAVWFSKNADYEITAAKGVLNKNTGAFQWLDKEGTACVAGVCRFAVALDSGVFYPWSWAPNALRMPRKHAERLAVIGKERGANPADWYASPADVHADKWLLVQVHVQHNGWLTLTDDMLEDIQDIIGHLKPDPAGRTAPYMQEHESIRLFCRLLDRIPT